MPRPSAAAEFAACALWAREHLQQKPDKTIGILLPDVSGQRAELERVLREILTQDSTRPGEQNSPLFEFTLGLPLADVPVIAAALALLQWCVDPQEQETITWLMTTGFFGSSSDSAVLAEADIEVRRHLSVPELEMDEALERFYQFSNSAGGSRVVMQWVRNMRNARKLLEKSQGRTRTCAEWIATAISILREAGWPGEQQWDSIGFQVSERWQHALEQVSALSFSDRRYEFRDFLALLSSHLRSTIFSPESQNAPITISGILESAGRSFDAVWIMGATDEALPANARMHPLLPAWLQMETAMPGSRWDLDAQLAATALDRLRHSTDELVFSYAEEGSEGAQRPSALLAHLDGEESESSAPAGSLLTQPFIDEMAIPWPGGRAAGGQGVLKDQSACPFKAFAGKRLGASELPSLELGLSPLQKGNIIHNVLASLWSDERMRNSDNLQGLIVAGGLAALIEQHVSRSLKSTT